MHTLGKVLWFFTTPSNILLALALIGVVWALITGRRGGAGDRQCTHRHDRHWQ